MREVEGSLEVSLGNLQSLLSSSLSHEKTNSGWIGLLSFSDTTVKEVLVWRREDQISFTEGTKPLLTSSLLLPWVAFSSALG